MFVKPVKKVQPVGFKVIYWQKNVYFSLGCETEPNPTLWIRKGPESLWWLWPSCRFVDGKVRTEKKTRLFTKETTAKKTAGTFKLFPRGDSSTQPNPKAIIHIHDFKMTE